ncbi:MAG TPA: hypothetical protein VE505_20150, partial [Vicinamibacterales bacterium]|nr:hypothetical protein [Vicinamibacterales bacterium]
YYTYIVANFVFPPVRAEIPAEIFRTSTSRVSSSSAGQWQIAPIARYVRFGQVRLDPLGRFDELADVAEIGPGLRTGAW